jgi:hypothetical protein
MFQGSWYSLIFDEDLVHSSRPKYERPNTPPGRPESTEVCGPEGDVGDDAKSSLDLLFTLDGKTR